MLTPDYLFRVAEGAENIASQLHTDIIKRIVERMLIRLGRGEKYLLTATDKWQIETLQQSGYLLEDIQKELQKATRRQESEIKAAMEEAGVNALDYDNAVYEAAGLSPAQLTQSPQLIRIMQRNYEATLGEWQNYTRTTATAAQNAFIRACDKAYTLVMSGAVSYTQAVKEAIQEIVSDGVKIIYPTGSTDTIETATARAVRTGIAQAAGDIQIARMVEMEWDIVLTSAHIGARSGDGGMNPGNHLWWQGQFFSRTGKTKDFPDFYASTGYGTGEGLSGWNCRHSFGPGDGINNPFIEIGYEENHKQEQLNKRQRALERRIRKTKREVAGLQAAVDNASDERLKFELQQTLDRKSHRLQEQNKAYNKFCDDNKLKTQPERLRIAEWNRETAAKARGAAKRFENAGNHDIMERKNKGDNFIEPMPKKQLQSITKAFKKQGGMIQMDKHTDQYLASKKAEAITYDAKTVLLRTRPGRAAVFEEMIHATQYRLGKNNGSYESRLRCEIEAQEKLIKYSKAYKLTVNEVKQTMKALESYQKELEALKRGDNA